MSADRRVTSVFGDTGTLTRALEGLRQAGVRTFTVYSPVGLLGLEHLLPRRGSPIRFVVLVAAVLGGLIGFWASIGSAGVYALIVGGKHPASIVPYCVIGFELTILFGGIAALVAIFGFADLRPGAPAAGYDQRFEEDKFGIVVDCSPESAAAVARLLRDAGAEEVHEQPSG
jgi:hypothetical protein